MLLKQRVISSALLFIAIYFFIFFDPLALVQNRYSYVLVVSPKYTLILIPIFAVLISTQFDWLSKIFQKITPKYFLSILVLLPLLLVLQANNSNIAFSFIQKTIPLYQPNEYYIRILNSMFNILITSIILFSTLIISGYLLGKGRFSTLWRKYNLSTVILLLTLFLLPFLFFFNNNYGIGQILSKSFLTSDQKFVLIKGSEETNKLIIYINSNFQEENILLVDSYPTSFIYHLDKSPNHIYLIPKDFSTTIQKYIESNKIDLVLANSNDSTINSTRIADIPNIKPIYQTKNSILFEVVKNY
jgi:cell division protein FtsW (lipid II flippase)